MLYSSLAPVAVIFLARGRELRRSAALVLAVSALAASAQMLLASLYFGSPMPLPFYAKALALYGETIHSEYRAVPVEQLLVYLRSYWHLLGIVLVAIAVGRKAARRDAYAFEIGLGLATLLFLIYYAKFVLQIMYYDQRFYYPTFPAIAFLACRALPMIAEHVKKRDLRPNVVQRAACLFILIYTAGSLALSAQYVLQGLSFSVADGDVGDFDVVREYRARYAWYWPYLDAFSRLPDDS